MPGHTHGELGVELPIERERRLGARDRIRANRRIGIGERTELELFIPEEQRDHGEHANPGVTRERTPELDVRLIDLVGIVRFERAETELSERRRDLEALLDRTLRFVARVEAAERGREEPDAGGEFQVELERRKVREHGFGGAPDGLGAVIDQHARQRTRGARGGVGELEVLNRAHGSHVVTQQRYATPPSPPRLSFPRRREPSDRTKDVRAFADVRR